MNESKFGCSCNCAPTLIFSCSGGSDVGMLSDLAARELTKRGVGKMYCLAGIGGKVSGILKTTEAAGKIMAIDGCLLDCAKKTLEGAGFMNFAHLRLNDMGIKKGEAKTDQDSIESICMKSSEMLDEMK